MTLRFGRLWRHRCLCLCLLFFAVLPFRPGVVQAQPALPADSPSKAPASVAAGVSAGTSTSAPVSAWPARPTPGLQVPRLTGRLRAADLGLVVNLADPYSVAVGLHYQQARGLAEHQVLRLTLPQRPVLSREEFETLQRSINSHFGPGTQALALAWVAPYAVECNAITGALAMGFDAELCRQSCAASRVSRYFNSATARPMEQLGFRPSMLLAAASLQQAKALIDRGVAADGALRSKARPIVSVMFQTTKDVARNVRSALYPKASTLPGAGVQIEVGDLPAWADAPLLLMALTGSEKVNFAPKMNWAAGGLGDHLTSIGGDLLGAHGQSTALEWIDAGATASHGAVSEPCNHLQKFPHPWVLLLNYLQGSTVIEAYWKSVAWPQQSLFVGEPLAAPFAPPLPP